MEDQKRFFIESKSNKNILIYSKNTTLTEKISLFLFIWLFGIPLIYIALLLTFLTTNINLSDINMQAIAFDLSIFGLLYFMCCSYADFKKINLPLYLSFKSLKLNLPLTFLFLILWMILVKDYWLSLFPISQQQTGGLAWFILTFLFIIIGFIMIIFVISIISLVTQTRGLINNEERSFRLQGSTFSGKHFDFNFCFDQQIAIVFQYYHLITPGVKPTRLNKSAKKGVFLELENKKYLIFSDIKNYSHLYAEELSHYTNWPLVIKEQEITMTKRDLAFSIY